MYLWYPLTQAQSIRCVRQNHETYLLIEIIYIAKLEIKGPGTVLFIFLERLLYEVCLVWRKDRMDRIKCALERNYIDGG